MVKHRRKCGTGKKPDVSHLQEFGCDIWIKWKGQSLSKLGGNSSKAKKYTFMGFTEDPVIIKYYDPELRKIRESRNYEFVEPKVMEQTTDNMRLEGEVVKTVNPPLPKGAEEEDQQTAPLQLETEKTPESAPEALRCTSCIHW